MTYLPKTSIGGIMISICNSHFFFVSIRLEFDDFQARQGNDAMETCTFFLITGSLNCP